MWTAGWFTNQNKYLFQTLFMLIWESEVQELSRINFKSCLYVRAISQSLEQDIAMLLCTVDSLWLGKLTNTVQNTSGTFRQQTFDSSRWTMFVWHSFMLSCAQPILSRKLSICSLISFTNWLLSTSCRCTTTISLSLHLHTMYTYWTDNNELV